MNMHENARMTVHGRILLVRRVCDEGSRAGAAADAAGVSERTADKWLAPFRAGRERMVTTGARRRSADRLRPRPRRSRPWRVCDIGA